MAVFEQKCRVNISHINSSAFITNIGMLSILESVACNHSDVVGFGINDIPTTHLSWVLLAWKVQILQRVKYGTELTVRTWAKPSHRVYTYRDFEVLNEKGEVVCIATSKWALVNTLTGNIEKITDDIIGKYYPEERNVFENLEIEKLLEPKSFSSEFIYKTQRRDIDVNQHMHNLNYLYLAYETMPATAYESEECNHIEIMYKKGIKLEDTSKCTYSYSEDAHFVTIKSEDEKFLHAIIKLY